MMRETEKPYIIIERKNKDKPDFLHFIEFDTIKELKDFYARLLRVLPKRKHL